MPVGLKILLSSLVMTLVTVMLGLYALEGERQLGDTALRMYDSAFMSINYVRMAQDDFERVQNIVRSGDEMAARPMPAESERQRLLDVARGASTNALPVRRAADPKVLGGALASVLDDLDVAIDRSMTGEARRDATLLRSRVAAVSAATDRGALSTIAHGFDEVTEHYADDGYAFRNDAELAVASHRHWTLVAIGVAIGAGLVATALLCRSVVPALRRAAAVAPAVSAGRFDNAIALPRRVRRSETAALLHALATMQATLLRDVRDAQARSEERTHEQAERDRRSDRVEGLVVDFRDSFTSSTDIMFSASVGLESTARSMATAAEQSQRQAVIVASAIDQANTATQIVASACEELSASIEEIRGQVAGAAAVAGEAVEDVRRTDNVVAAMSDGAQRIGKVVELISRIASQTSLLALNATIEAARAGESGRGFAVVASEVKNLARETAKATEEISAQVNFIQATTRETVDAIGGITGKIERLSGIASSIAVAVEQQGSATAEIARNVSSTAQATRAVVENVEGVSRTAVITGSTATHVLDAAAALASQAKGLTGEVSSFVSGLRAAA